MSTSDHVAIEEPARDKRVYYRHKDSGEVAYLVRVGGRPKLRVNRPNELILKNLTDDWYADEDFGLRLEPMQRAIVAFEADKAICKMLGLYQMSRRDWTLLRDKERIEWAENGPRPTGDDTRDRVRRAAYDALMGVLNRVR